MSSVDNRIVEMKFNNSQFEQGAATTMSTLDKLKSSLGMAGATKGLSDVAAAAEKVNLGPIEGGISKISGAFVALSTVAITAISNITTKLMGMGTEMAKQLTGIDAMRDGFSDYELKIGATQTIMSGTGESMKTVTKYLKDLDIYADKTIYSLSDMVNNIGKFTNAGVKLPIATKAMIGISNSAALSGASTQDAARAMYNFGEAIGKGSMRLGDWKSIETAQMGTKRFKEELIKGAIATGDLTKGADGVVRTVKGSEVTFKTFTSTLQEGWLTTEAMTKTLNRYADGSKGVGKEALAAAQDIKSFSMMMETLKAAAGTGWTDTFDIVIGNLKESKKLWTEMTNSISGVLDKSAEARNKLLGDWKKLGGREDLIQGFKNLFGAMGDVITPIKEAFRDIFPAMTGQQLADITAKFKEFTANLRLSDETMDNLKRTFKGVFAVFSIVVNVIKAAVGFIFDLVGAVNTGNSGILKITANIGDFLVGLNNVVTKGGLVTGIFDKLSQVLVPVVKNIKDFAGALVALATGQNNDFLDNLSTKFSSLKPIIESIQATVQSFVDFIRDKLAPVGDLLNFGGDTGGAAKSGVAGLQASMEGLPTVMDNVKSAWDKLVAGFKSAGNFLRPVMDSLNDFGTSLKDKIAEFVSGLGIEDALAVINTGFLIMLYRSLKSFSDKVGGLVDNYGKMFESIGGTFDQLTNHLKTMQQEVKADIILKIAASLALLAAAVWVLSKIDVKSLGIALGAISIMLAELMIALKLLEKQSPDGSKSSLQITLLAGALVALALALVIMAGAIALLGNMETSTLITGITAVAAILGVVIAATGLLNKTGGAASIVAASVAIGILAVSLTAFAGAIKLYSAINTGTLLEGGLKIAAALFVISETMGRMPPNMLASSAALFIVAHALIVLAGALKLMGSLSGGEMAKSLIMLGGSLFIISLALNAMNGAVAGAAAILLFAIALSVLVPPLVVLGQMDLKSIGVALLALAGVFAVLGLASLILGPIVPVILGLAAAIALLGVGAVLVGVGLLAFSMGLASLAASGAAGAAVLVAAIISISQLIPLIMHQVGLGILAFAKVISEGGPILTDAFVTLLESLIDAGRKILPKLPPLIKDALDAFLKVVKDSTPKLIQAGFDLLMDFLDGIGNNIYKVVTKAGDIVVKFIRGIGDNYKKIVDEGANTIIKFVQGLGENGVKIVDAATKAVIKFVNGIADSIRDNADDMRAAGRNIASAIADGLTGGLWSRVGDIKDAAVGAAKSALNAAKNFLKIGSPSKEFAEVGRFSDMGFANGLEKYSYLTAAAAETVGSSTLDSMRAAMARVSDTLASDIDVNPTITPVLDLTQLQKDASSITTMIADKANLGAVSFGQATGISADQQSVAAPVTETPTPVVQEVKFEQNNYSPKALSATEIYRNTKNQLALAKEELAK